MTVALRRRPLALLGLYVGLSLMLTMVHAHEVNFGVSQQARYVRHTEILTGEGRSPYTYRVLVPWLVAATQPILQEFLGRHADVLEFGYVGWRFLFTLALLLLFDAWLRCWLDPAWAVAGTILLAALHPVSYLGYWFQPASCADFALWVLVALLTRRVRFTALYPLVAIGTLNRETALFAVLIYAALRYGKDPPKVLALRTAALTACWAIPFATLRWVVGVKPWDVDLLSVARSNFTGSGWVTALVFFGALWVLPWVSWHRRPVPLRRLAVALTLTYLPLQFIFGRIIEVRLLLPLSLVYVPLALMVLREAVAQEP